MIVEGLKETIATYLEKGEDPLHVILGQAETKQAILASILAGHHVLIAGPPGVGKTTLARHLAAILPPVRSVEGCPFHCDPADPVCPACRAQTAQGDALQSVDIAGKQRFVRIQGSPDLTAEDLLGDIDPGNRHGPGRECSDRDARSPAAAIRKIHIAHGCFLQPWTR